MPVSPLLAPAAALVLALVAGTASAAPTPPPASHGDPVFPTLGNHGYHALGYDLDLDYHPVPRTVDATVTLTARSTQHLTRFELDCLGLDVHQVRVDGRPAAFTPHDEKLTIVPTRPIAAGAVLTVRITYTADPRRPLPHTGWVPTPDGFALAPQPASAHTVFPCDDLPAEKAAFTIHLTTPEGTGAVANGSPTGELRHDGLVTRTFVSRDPIAPELVQAAVGSLTVISHPGPDGLPLRDAVPTARASELAPALALTTGQLSWIEQRLGPFPLETYGLLPVNSDDPRAFGFTGLETQTLTLYKPDFLKQPERLIGAHMMHELVHSWFGDSVSPRTWADLWLNEGHADFYGLLYRYERGWPDGLGLTTLDARMRDTYARGDQWRHDSGPVAAPGQADLFDDQRYLGGVLVLYALREQVGPGVFDRIERTFLRRYRNSSASTRDYIDTASEVSGQDLHGFLTAWLYGSRTPPMPHHPDWTTTAVTTGPAAGAHRQDEAAPPRRPFPTPAAAGDSPAAPGSQRRPQG
ncbi:M1 family metallopeptidase [Kitasatospora sp. NPDC052896]|uniref:M1 family metallopeptidase n=1 Tax=Kitasatospora sp. NPDC052896 TaxID=3364061 RepID=UPI0037C818B3